MTGLQKLLIAGMIGWAFAGSAQTIKMGTVAPEGSPWHEALLEMGQEWKEISGGKVKLRIYPGGVAGDEPDMMRKMRIGQLHAGALTSMGFITTVPDIEVLTFPMQMDTDAQVDAVIARVGPELERQLEAKGFKVLTWTSSGWVHFYSREPAVSAEDLRRLKLFFWGSDTVYTRLLKNLGFHPVSLSVTDLLTSLQTGLVDMFAAPPVAALSFQWFGLAKNMSTMRWQPMPNLVVLSMKQWNRIPEAMRPELEASARRIGAKLQIRSRELEQEAIEAMKKHGLVVHEAPEEVVQEFRDLVETHAVPEFIGKRISHSMYEELQTALRELEQD